MRISIFKIKILSCFFVFAVCGAVFADICIEEKITTNIAGRPFDGIKKTYITKNKTLLEDPTISKRVIYDYDSKKVYLIDDLKKDISVYSLNGFMLPLSEKIYSDFIFLKEKDILIRESGLRKKIGKYNCSETVIYIPKIAALARIWTTKDIDTSLASFYSFLENNNDVLLKKLIPVLKNGNAYVVENVITIVRPKEPEKYIKTELVNISSGEVSDSLFKLPADYRILNMDSGQAESPLRENDAQGEK